MNQARPPLLGFAAYSGTGKTSLLVRLLPVLRDRDVRVGVIKHAHHSFDPDIPGKDSYELRRAGARQMLVASARRWALVVEEDAQKDIALPDLVARLDWRHLDLVVVEGFKHAELPKIELFRRAVGKPAMYPNDPCIIAVATDAPLPVPTGLPVLDLNDPPAIAAFIAAWMQPAQPQQEADPDSRI